MSNNTIILKRSSVTGKKPTEAQLQYGELSINYADGELYYKSSDNTIKAIGQKYGEDIEALKSGKLDANGTALKATSDASGNNIANTYIKGLSVSGKTITYTKGNGDIGTITTQDTTYGAATSSTLGLVKVGSNITNTSGTISLTKENVTSALGYTPPTTDTTYSSMTGATASTDGKGGLVPTPIAGQQTSYLRGDGTWAVPTNTTYSAGDGISLSGTKFSNSGVRSIAAGSTANVLSVNTNGTTSSITINNVANATAATKATQDSAGQQIDKTYIKGLSVSGKTITYTRGDDTTGTITTQDTTYSAATSSTLGLVKVGSNITNSSGTISLTKDNVTAALGYTPPTTNTTYSDMKGATASAAGTHGLVPAPAAGKQTSFLRGDGTWVVPTNTTYSAGEGIGLSGTTFSNSGVRSIVAGSTANVLKVNTNGTEASITINNVANATVADKLNTARKIALSGGATGTATSFNGTADISIPVTAVKESYLSWGGKNFAGGYGPIDAAMIPDLGANRLAFLNAAGIQVQYSTDAGATWSDYGLTNAQKTSIFAQGFGCTVGKATGKTITTDCQLRITITSDLAKIYSVLNKFALYVSTNGSGGCWCTIDGATKANPSTFVTFADRIGVNGWSGWNIINTSGITTYANNDSQYRTLRFTFGITSHNSNNGSWAGLSVMRIMGFGGVGWTTPSNMAKYGSIYSYDADQNVSFPAAVTASKFYQSEGQYAVIDTNTIGNYAPTKTGTGASGTWDIAITGNAATATKATQDASGNTITSYYAPKASPALTGTPTAPTAAEGTNTTQVATTQFVQSATSKCLSLEGGTMKGALNMGNQHINGANYVYAQWYSIGASIASSTAAKEILIKQGGWIYSRTPSQILSDIGAASASEVATLASRVSALEADFSNFMTKTEYQAEVDAAYAAIS